MKRVEFLESLMGVPFIPKVLRSLSSEFTQPLEENKWINSIFKTAVWVDSKYNTLEIEGDTINFDNYRKSYELVSKGMSSPRCAFIFFQREKGIRIESFIKEVGMHCMYFSSYKYKRARYGEADVYTNQWPITPNPGAIERLGRSPVATDKFYLIINRNRDLLEWQVTDGGHTNYSIHFLISFYLTNDPKYRKVLPQYTGKALEYLPDLKRSK